VNVHDHASRVIDDKQEQEQEQQLAGCPFRPCSTSIDLFWRLKLLQL
jgi:hypothetical protein